MDIVSLLGPQARARRNALRSLQVMRTRREEAQDATPDIRLADRRTSGPAVADARPG